MAFGYIKCICKVQGGPFYSVYPLILFSDRVSDLVWKLMGYLGLISRIGSYSDVPGKSTVGYFVYIKMGS